MTRYLLALFLCFGLLLILYPKVALAECSGTPSKPTKTWAKWGPFRKMVTLNWKASSDVDRYALIYGYEKDKYIFGSLDIGGAETTRYVVKAITRRGVPAYFRLIPFCGTTSGPQSDEMYAIVP